MGRSGPGQRAGRGPGEPGGDLLFRVLRRSTIGAEGFHGRVRDGIGCWAPRCGHQAVPAPAGWLWGLGRVPAMGRGTPQGAAARGGVGEFAKAGEAARSVVRRLMAGRAVIGRRRHEGQGVAGRGFAAARRRGPGLSPKPVFLQRSGKIGSLFKKIGIERVRAISTGQLHGLPRFHPRPINVVVFHGSRRDLVLRGASRLDAFSGYPVRT